MCITILVLLHVRHPDVKAQEMLLCPLTTLGDGNGL